MTRLWSLVVRWSWRRVAARNAALGERLAAFARTEQGSFLTLRLAANQTPSAARAALYLRHAGDEARHARLFHTLAEQMVGRALPLLADAEDLFAFRGEVGFLAFVHHAERRGREQFELIAGELARQDKIATAQLFEAIAQEERHHERYSLELLRELGGSEAAVRRELRRVRRWEAWRFFRRSGRSIAGAVYDLLIVSLVPLFWLYGLLLRRERAGFRAP